MLAFDYACEGLIPAAVSITGDTGSERSRLLSTGEPISAEDFYREFVKPRGKRFGIKTFFVRAKDGAGAERPALWDQVKAAIATFDGEEFHLPIHIPLFGQTGRLRQTCTDNWKIAAIKQCARALGATTMRSAQGLHSKEFWRRAEVRLPLGPINGFATYQSVRKVIKERVLTNGGFNFESGEHLPVDTVIQAEEVFPVRWLTHYYPLGEGPLKMDRTEIRAECDRRGLPYLITSECDMCPHKDFQRWATTPAEVIDEIAAEEAKMRGVFYFTDTKLPLKEAIPVLYERGRRVGKLFDGEGDFGCSNSHCGG